MADKKNQLEQEKNKDMDRRNFLKASSAAAVVAAMATPVVGAQVSTDEKENKKQEANVEAKSTKIADHRRAGWLAF